MISPLHNSADEEDQFRQNLLKVNSNAIVSCAMHLISDLIAALKMTFRFHLLRQAE